MLSVNAFTIISLVILIALATLVAYRGDVVLHFTKLSLGISSQPELTAYRSHGSEDSVHIIGRVTESWQKPTKRPTTLPSALIEYLRYYLSYPLAGVAVTVRYGQETKVLQTDEFGHYHASFSTQPNVSAKAESWLTESPQEVYKHDIIISEAKAQYGIISDIDDTVLVSGATKKIKLIYRTVSKTAEERKAFPGVVSLYHKLVAGTSSQPNPIFYVSSSHWHLYEFLTTFFAVHNLPNGPLFLKPTGPIREILKGIGTHDHKFHQIDHIMTLHPHLRFVLLGDSGQHDAEIYSQIANKYPDRILAIYIRDVTPYTDKLVEDAKNKLPASVPLISATSSSEFATHMQEIDLINTAQTDAPVAH